MFSQANSFLSDKATYYLCMGTNLPDSTEEIEPLVIDGFPVRTVE